MQTRVDTRSRERELIVQGLDRRVLKQSER